MFNVTPRRPMRALHKSAAVIGAALIFSTPALANERDSERASVANEVLHLLHARHDQQAEQQSSQPAPALI